MLYRDTPQGTLVPVRTAHPRWLVLFFFIPMLAWIAMRYGSDLESPFAMRIARNAGYAALAALALTYLYVWRRQLLHRYGVSLLRWTRWHIGAAYLAFALMLIHGGGKLWQTPLTSCIVVLFTLVMLSGMLGLLCQKLMFRLLRLTVEREYGMTHLEQERRRCSEDASALIENYSLLTARDITDWPAFCALVESGDAALRNRIYERGLGDNAHRVVEEVAKTKNEPTPDQVETLLQGLNAVLRNQLFCNSKEFSTVGPEAEVGPYMKRDLSEREIERRNRLFLEKCCSPLIVKSRKPPETAKRFFEDAVDRYLGSEFPSWRWLFSPAALEPVSRNHYLRVRTLIAPDQAGLIEQLWAWVEKRRQMDLEYSYHRLARVWLFLHGPVAWALLVLVLAHAVSSVIYGGVL